VSTLHGKRAWRIPPRQLETETMLTTQLQISQTMAQILINRGLSEAEAAHDFIFGRATIKPVQLDNLSRAADRLRQAGANREKVLIHGDYDVDGITSCAMLYLALTGLGMEVDWFLPNRFVDGYGFSQRAVDLAQKQGCRVIVTTDCGITSEVEIDSAIRAGIDVIVTDHHQPGPPLPAAAIIVNPRLGREGHELAGAGVVYYLLRQLFKMVGGDEGELMAERYLDLAALGTIADVVPLRGANRPLVTRGLAAMNRDLRPGLRCLLNSCGQPAGPIDAWTVAFVLAPRLNACGRLETPDPALFLLLSETEAQAREWAGRLEAFNRRRKELENGVLAEAEAMIAATGQDQTPALVLASAGWHQGVLGIVASRLVEKYGKPALVLTLLDDQAKGSGRSLPGLQLVQALQLCAEHLDKYGGHHLAAGLSLPVGRLEAFAQAFMAVAERSRADYSSQTGLRVDAVVAETEMNKLLSQELLMLEPFGAGNPLPNLLAEGLIIGSVRSIGKAGEHIRLEIAGPEGMIPALGFGLGQRSGELEYAAGQCWERQDIVFHVRKNRNNLRPNEILFQIQDFRASRQPMLEGLRHHLLDAEMGMDLVVHELPFWLEELGAYFSRQQQTAGLRLACLLSCLSPDKQDQIWTRGAQGELDLLLTTFHYLHYHRKKFVFTFPSIRRILAIGQLETAAEERLAELGNDLGADVFHLQEKPEWLLQSPMVIRRWTQQLIHYPVRQQLIAVYRYLQLQRELSGSGAMEVSELGFFQWYRGITPCNQRVAAAILESCLCVLEEINLLRRYCQAGRWWVELAASNGEKKDLSASQRYSEGEFIRARFNLGVGLKERYADQ